MIRQILYLVLSSQTASILFFRTTTNNPFYPPNIPIKITLNISNPHTKFSLTSLSSTHLNFLPVMIIQSDQTNSQMCAIHLQKFTLETVTELISQRDTIQSRRDWNPNQLNHPFCSCFRFLSLVVYNATRHKQTYSGFRFCKGVILNFNHQNVVILCGENKDKEELRRSLKLNRTNSCR